MVSPLLVMLSLDLPGAVMEGQKERKGWIGWKGVKVKDRNNKEENPNVTYRCR
jgi:hypothetical protein